MDEFKFKIIFGWVNIFLKILSVSGCRGICKDRGVFFFLLYLVMFNWFSKFFLKLFFYSLYYGLLILIYMSMGYMNKSVFFLNKFGNGGLNKVL